jgi:uncharacterized MnhB-related membrane protein
MNEILLTLMLALAILTLLVKDLFATVVLLGVFSLLSSLFFYILGAPDVALTEAAVGTGIGTVVFIWIARKTEGGSDETALD